MNQLLLASTRAGGHTLDLSLTLDPKPCWEEIALSSIQTVPRLTDCPNHLSDLVQFSFSLFLLPCTPLSLPSTHNLTFFITSRRNGDLGPSVMTAHADSSSHMHGFLHLAQSGGLLYCNRFNIPQMSQLIYIYTPQRMGWSIAWP